ncbi:MAG TPA: response regulator [Deltaproteobacteria bacterium]|nr:response regulator [Deltaproteobacteria bacterium]
MAVKRKKIVLIVDNNRDIRSYLRHLLQSSFDEYDLELFTEASSDTALKTIKEKNGAIDLVFTNIERPGIDGYTFIHAVKQKYPHISIIICSGSARRGDLEEMSQDNLIVGYIRKPIKDQVFISQVRSIFDAQNLVRIGFEKRDG